MRFQRFSGLRLVRRRPDLVFWGIFAILNGLLFLPFTLLNQETTTFLPTLSLFANGAWLSINRLFLWRENLDPFRLSLELTLLLTLLIWAPGLRRRAVRHLVMVVYLLALCYHLYEAIMTSVYLSDPVFYSQYYLARDGLPFLFSALQASPWLYVIAVTFLLTAVMALVALLNLLLASSAADLHRITRGSLLLMTGFCLFAGLRYQFYTASPEMVVSSLGFKLERNIVASWQLYKDVASFDDGSVQRTYDYRHFRLTQTPDIYLIFVESYGSVLYKRKNLRKEYIGLLNELEDQLYSANWQIASALSESPMWGGGSWMAYTSLLFGLRIDSQPRYLSLFNKYQVEAYPNLGRYLQQQGYHFVWVTSLTDHWDERMWAKHQRFLGVDRIVNHKGLRYQGVEYGWGPSPPDQYTLNYARQQLKAGTKQPLFFFTITQNSHYPWTLQPQLAADWQMLNQSKAATEDLAENRAKNEADALEQGEKQQNYLRAIDYQLRMLSDFVLHNGDENSLFILIGDHQPPQVSRRSDGWATPVHILSKNRALIEAFAEYGFTPGLKLNSLEPSLHHEGFYSLLVRILLGQSAATSSALPAYLPHGVEFAR
jgi:phosphoglycerol transferase MdoB-like AlkP superfamily enzyme